MRYENHASCLAEQDIDITYSDEDKGLTPHSYVLYYNSGRLYEEEKGDFLKNKGPR